MITYLALKKNPRLFRNLTGLSSSQFDKLYAAVEPAWLTGERDRLSRSHRQRAIGGGRDYAIELREQLLMTLMGRRLNLSTSALGFLFGVDKSTASRNRRRVLTALNQVEPAKYGWTEAPPPGRRQNIEQLLHLTAPWSPKPCWSPASMTARRC